MRPWFFRGLGFGIGKEGANLIARAAIERTLCKVATLRVGEAPDLRFYGRDRRQADTEFIHPKADENRHGLRIAGKAAANACKSLVFAGALNGQRDKTQQRRDSGRRPSERAWDDRDPSRGCIE